MSRPQSSHAESDQAQCLAEENARLRRLLAEWANSEYCDADGEICTAAEFAPSRHARSMEALAQ
jgi:hypothetical protein